MAEPGAKTVYRQYIPASFSAKYSQSGKSPGRSLHALSASRRCVFHTSSKARGRSPAELALLFGKAFGQSPQYWLNLQSAYDLKLAERAIGGRLKAVSEMATA